MSLFASINAVEKGLIEKYSNTPRPSSKIYLPIPLRLHAQIRIKLFVNIDYTWAYSNLGNALGLLFHVVIDIAY